MRTAPAQLAPYCDQALQPKSMLHGCSVALDLQNVCTNSEAASENSTFSCTQCSHGISSGNPRLAAVHQTNASVIVTVSTSWHNASRANRFRHLIVVCHHLNAVFDQPANQQ